MRTKMESGDEKEGENGKSGRRCEEKEKVGRRTKNEVLGAITPVLWLQRKSPKISSENPLQEK